MNRWLDFVLVATAVLASATYAIYSLGPKRIKDAYSRWATKHLGLRVARWFSGSAKELHNCNNCPANSATKAPPHSGV